MFVELFDELLIALFKKEEEINGIDAISISNRRLISVWLPFAYFCTHLSGLQC